MFFILLALADGEKHGYAIMQDVKILSDGQVNMGPGTLYATIIYPFTLLRIPPAR